MEPMTLGSPTHSPSNSPNATYLPPFLMGEINHPTAPRTNSLSPTKGRSLAFGSSPPMNSTPDIQRTKLFMNPQSPGYASPHGGQHNASSVSFTNKQNGPPTQGLFDTLHKPLRQNQNKDPSLANASLFPNMSSNQSYIFNQSNNQTLNDSNFFNNSSVCNEEECWVTIFGFTSACANVVFAHFSNCGNIIDRYYTSQGNWAHICYSTRAEKLRALSLNGRQLSPGVMVGVVDCKEPPATHDSSRTENRLQQSFSSPRPLCPSAVPAPAAPERSVGILSKAMEYVFGL